MLAKLSGLNPKGPYLSLEKEKENFLLCVYLLKNGRMILDFDIKYHVAVV